MDRRPLSAIVLAPALRRLSPNNSLREYYLTDTVAVLHDAGYAVATVVVPDPAEALQVNDRAQLATAEAEQRARINGRWMRRGVTMWDPERNLRGRVGLPRRGRHIAAWGDPGGPDHGRPGRGDRPIGALGRLRGRLRRDAESHGRIVGRDRRTVCCRPLRRPRKRGTVGARRAARAILRAGDWWHKLRAVPLGL